MGAVAAFIGLASAKKDLPIWGLTSVQNHREDSEVQKAYGDHSINSADGRPPYQSVLKWNQNPTPPTLTPMRRMSCSQFTMLGKALQVELKMANMRESLPLTFQLHLMISS